MPVETHLSAVLKAIGEMTDPGAFEALVRQVIAFFDADFAALVATGTGEHGKPVRDSLDGLGYVQRSPVGVWLALAATTQKGHTLRKKLESDLDKMLNELPKGEFSQAKLVVACNSRVGSTLLKELQARAKKQGAQLVVASGPWLADQITKPDNQWIGAQFLGVPADYPDFQTLRDASHRFLIQLEARIIGGAEGLSRTPTTDFIMQEMGRPLVQLIGPSGSTKTTTAFLVGKQVAQAGGLVVWIEESNVESASTLQEAVDRALEGLGFRFGTSAGRTLVEGEIKAPCLVIVDDIERLPQASRAWEKVSSWARSIAPRDRDGPAPRSKTSQLCILCTRHSIRSVTPTLYTEENPPQSYTVINAVPPSIDNLVSRVTIQLRAEEQDISEYEAREVVQSLWNDPLLVGMYLELRLSGGVSSPSPHNVWDAMVRQGLARAAEQAGVTPSLVERAWDFIGDYVLTTGSPFVDLGRLLEAATQKGVHPGLMALIDEARLLSSKHDRLMFRHDRLRDWLVGSRIHALYTSGGLAETWKHQWDPFFVPSIAMAVLASNLSRDFISEVRKQRPEALIEPLRYATIKEDHPLLKAAVDWLDSCGNDWKAHPELGVVISSLAGARGDHLSPIFRRLPGWPAILLLRIAHGDALAAIKEFGITGLSTSYSDRYLALHHAKKHHVGVMVTQLRQVLRDSGSQVEVLAAATEVAAALRAGELVDDVLGSYGRASPRDLLMGPVLALLFLSTVDNRVERARPIIKDWRIWRDRRGQDYDWILDYLRFVFSMYGCSQDTATQLVGILQDQRQGWLAVWGLHDCREPELIELLVRTYATEWANRGMTDELWFRDSTQIFRRFDPRLYDSPPTSAERQVIVHLAQDTTQPLETRKVAIRLWEKIALRSELAQLREVQIENEERTIKLARIRAGDACLSDWLEELLPEWPPLVEYARYIWSPRVRAVVGHWLDRLSSSKGAEDEDSLEALHFAMRFLVTVPRSDGRELFEKRLDRWPTVQPTIEAALLLGGEKCVNWAIAKLRQSERPQQLLEYFMAGFGSNRDVPLVDVEAATILAWEESLQWMRKQDLASVFALARSKGLDEWARPRLQHRLEYYDRRRLCPTAEDLVEEVQEDLKRGRLWPTIHFMEDIGAKPQEALAALKSGLSTHDLEEVAESIEEFLVRFASRATLEDFWKDFWPTGEKSTRVRSRSKYLVAVRHPPVE